MFVQEILYFTVTLIAFKLYIALFYVLGKKPIVHKADRELTEEDYTDYNTDSINDR